MKPEPITNRDPEVRITKADASGKEQAKQPGITLKPVDGQSGLSKIHGERVRTVSELVKLITKIEGEKGVAGGLAFFSPQEFNGGRRLQIRPLPEVSQYEHTDEGKPVSLIADALLDSSYVEPDQVARFEELSNDVKLAANNSHYLDHISLSNREVEVYLEEQAGVTNIHVVLQ